MSKVKFAIIGCGRIAQRHAQHINAMGELKAVCDIKAERARELAQKYGSECFTDIDELLAKCDDIDVVSICTPNYLHAEQTIKALQANRNVLCEKPMALSVSDCERMIHTAESVNKRLFIVKQNRFNPPVIAVKEALAKGALGELFSVQLNCFWNRNDQYYLDSDWKGKAALDGGTLFTQFSHFIDLLYWMIGDVQDVQAYLGNFNHADTVEFEDTGVIAVKFVNGAIGTINYSVNSYKKNFEGSLTIFGSKGTIKIGGQYLNKLEYQNVESFEFGEIPETGQANDYGFYQGSMSNHDKVYANVIDVLANNAPIITNFLDGMKTVQIIEKIYKNAAQKNNG